MLDMRIPDTSMPHNAARRAQVCATIMLSGSISLPQLHATWCMNVGFGHSVLPLLYASSILTPLHDPVVARWLRSCVTERVLKKNLAKPTLDISSGHIKKWKGTFCQIIPQKKIWAKSRLGSANKPLRCISVEEHWIIWQCVIPSSSLQGNAAMQIQHWNLIAFLETQDPPRSWVWNMKFSPTINSIVTGRARFIYCTYTACVKVYASTYLEHCLLSFHSTYDCMSNE